jgi:hypothetical protein
MRDFNLGKEKHTNKNTIKKKSVSGVSRLQHQRARIALAAGGAAIDHL